MLARQQGETWAMLGSERSVSSHTGRLMIGTERSSVANSLGLVVAKTIMSVCLVLVDGHYTT